MLFAPETRLKLTAYLDRLERYRDSFFKDILHRFLWCRAGYAAGYGSDNNPRRSVLHDFIHQSRRPDFYQGFRWNERC